MKKNDIIVTICVDLSYEGYGVCKPEGFVVFVRGLLPNEEAKIVITKVFQHQAYGKVLEIIKPSEDRIEKDCPQFPRCGGCSLRHYSYEKELEWKRKKVQDALTNIGGLEVEVPPVLGMDHPIRYRNKLQAPVSNKEGNWDWGFYRTHSHDLIPCGDCLIEDEISVELLNVLLREFEQEEVNSSIRHILVRRGHYSKECMIVVVGKEKENPQVFSLLKRFGEENDAVHSIYWNINSEDTNVILGKESKHIYGAPIIHEELGDYSYRISPHSFFQVNSSQTIQLYNQVFIQGDFDPKDTVLDLYCGAGTISLWVSSKVKEVIGIEINPHAVEDAKENAKANQVENARFLCADAKDGVKQILDEGTPIDAVIVDPPRKGMDEPSKELINSIQPKKIVYVSCNPATLARDIHWFNDYGYQLQSVQPVDMFPRTTHVESVCLLTHKN